LVTYEPVAKALGYHYVAPADALKDTLERQSA